jgi:uncharacterized protein YkwD/uncharacterized membrane protein required for colicin V production
VNLVDAGVILVLALFAFSGVRRGFLLGVADLVGAVVAFLLAIRGYSGVSAWLASTIGLPRIMTNFIALMVLFLVGEVLFSFVAEYALRLIYRHVLRGPFRLIDSLLGVLPGLAKGVLVASALVAFFVLFPVNGAVQDEVRTSPLGALLTDQVSSVAPGLEALFGGSLQDTALFISPPTEQEGPRQMNFPVGLTVTEDSASEQAMFQMVNQERVKAGLKPLALDERLRAAALAHSNDMFRGNYFAHESQDGATPADRLLAAQIPFLAMGENLAYAPTVEVAHTGLMNSPGHRQNILSSSFGRIGIGVMDGGLYGKMFTQEFTN